MIKRISSEKSGYVAQATLELTASIIGAMVILCSVIAIFIWVNNNLFYRQQAYEERGTGSAKFGRERAGKTVDNYKEIQIDESKIPELNVFSAGGD